LDFIVSNFIPVYNPILFAISKKPVSRIRKLIAGNMTRRQWGYLVLTATFSEVPSEWPQKHKRLQ
jgi:hypothetical protein